MFKVADDSRLNVPGRDLRNGIEHWDEDVEEWLADEVGQQMYDSIVLSGAGGRTPSSSGGSATGFGQSPMEINHLLSDHCWRCWRRWGVFTNSPLRSRLRTS